MSKKSNVRRKAIAPAPPREVPRKAHASHAIPAPSHFHYATRQPMTTPAGRAFGTETPVFLLKSNARFKFLDINGLNSQAGNRGT